MATLAAPGLATSSQIHDEKRSNLMLAKLPTRAGSCLSRDFERRQIKPPSLKGGNWRCYRSDEDNPKGKLRSQLLNEWSYKEILERERERRGASQRSHFLPNVVSRLFGPAIFEASKLKVLFLGVDEDKHPEHLPRTYTLTHSDITAKLTLAVSQTINKAQLQGWYSRLQRDEVLAEWKKSQGSMSLHVHCHISGGHWLLDAIARLRFYIFRKELPVVLEAFRHGDQALLNKHTELDQALVWVYFHSNVKEFNRVECWGPLADAAKGASDAAKQAIHNAMDEIEQNLPKQKWKRPVKCPEPCDCCFPPRNIIPLPASFEELEDEPQTQQA